MHALFELLYVHTSVPFLVQRYLYGLGSINLCSENKTLKCPNCRCVSVRLVLNVTNRKDGIDYSNEVKCDSCRTALVAVYDGTTPHSKETLKCPKCKNNGIKIENAGIWD